MPKSWFPRLLNASEEELADYKFSGHGTGIHWDSLDEDISVPKCVLRDRKCGKLSAGGVPKYDFSAHSHPGL